MRRENTSSAMAASSTDTCSNERVARIHRGGAELLPVHLAEALEPADLDLAAFVLGLERTQRGVVLQVVALLAEVGAEQRRLRDVDVAARAPSPGSAGRRT